MNEDRYVIVRRDGGLGPRLDKAESDAVLAIMKNWTGGNSSRRPAYRIRCREKTVDLGFPEGRSSE